MDIHKPKPWHGWRELLKEVGTIVIGVLIALAGEQAVEWAHQQAELRETREAIREEVVDNLTAAETLLYENRCLQGVSDRLVAWAGGGPRVQVSAIVSPTFSFTIWDISSGPISRMPLKEKFSYARFYEELRNEQTVQAAGRVQASRLGRYIGLPSLTPADAHAMLQDISEGYNTLSAAIGNAALILRDGAALGLHPRPIDERPREVMSQECAVGGLPAPDFNKPAG
jgi:hypothetical protein